MVYILSGEDISSSRTRLLSLVNKDSQILRFDGRKNSSSEILEAFEAKSLFSEKKTIILEYFAKLKSDKVFEKAKSFIKDPDTILILWDEADVPRGVIKELSAAKSESFVFPKVFYQFIDGISPSNRETSAKLLNSLLKTLAAEQILYSITKRVRALCIFKEGFGSNYSETLNLAPWQVEKLARQANEWTKEGLSKFLLKLSQTDELLKTSGLPMSLAAHLDTMLLSDLN